MKRLRYASLSYWLQPTAVAVVATMMNGGERRPCCREYHQQQQHYGSTKNDLNKMTHRSPKDNNQQRHHNRQHRNVDQHHGSPRRQVGTVRKWFLNKGYGFIEDSQGLQYMAHANDIATATGSSVALFDQGARVSFQALETDRGWKAVAIRKELQSRHQNQHRRLDEGPPSYHHQRWKKKDDRRIQGSTPGNSDGIGGGGGGGDRIHRGHNTAGTMYDRVTTTKSASAQLNTKVVDKGEDPNDEEDDWPFAEPKTRASTHEKVSYSHPETQPSSSSFSGLPQHPKPSLSSSTAAASLAGTSSPMVTSNVAERSSSSTFSKTNGDTCSRGSNVTAADLLAGEKHRDDHHGSHKKRANSTTGSTFPSSSLDDFDFEATRSYKSGGRVLSSGGVDDGPDGLLHAQYNYHYHHRTGGGSSSSTSPKRSINGRSGQGRLLKLSWEQIAMLHGTKVPK